MKATFLLDSKFYLLILLKFSSVFLVQTFHVADEYYQGVEPAFLNSVNDHGSKPKLTWEWNKNVALRSPLNCYFIIFSFFLKDDILISKLAKLTNYVGGPLILSSRLIHALLSAIVEYKLYSVLYKLDKTTANWFLKLYSSSWFWYYNCSRTLINSFETILCTLALAYYINDVSPCYKMLNFIQYSLDQKYSFKNVNFDKNQKLFVENESGQKDLLQYKSWRVLELIDAKILNSLPLETQVYKLQAFYCYPRYLWIVGLSCAIRPTAIIPWIILFFKELILIKQVCNNIGKMENKLIKLYDDDYNKFQNDKLVQDEQETNAQPTKSPNNHQISNTNNTPKQDYFSKFLSNLPSEDQLKIQQISQPKRQKHRKINGNALLILHVINATSSTFAILIICITIDSLYYDNITSTLLNFLNFNFFSSGANIYGISPIHWVFTDATWTVFGLVPLLLLYIFVNNFQNSTFDPFGLFTSIIFTLAMFSIPGHKEHRFIMPLLPILMVATSIQISKSSQSQKFCSKLKNFSKINLFINVIVGIYFCTIHQSGPYNLHKTLVKRLKSFKPTTFQKFTLQSSSIQNNRIISKTFKNDINIFSLLPCHSLLPYSYYHKIHPKLLNIQQFECPPVMFRKDVVPKPQNQFLTFLMEAFGIFDILNLFLSNDNWYILRNRYFRKNFDASVLNVNKQMKIKGRETMEQEIKVENVIYNNGDKGIPSLKILKFYQIEKYNKFLIIYRKDASVLEYKIWLNENAFKQLECVFHTYLPLGDNHDTHICIFEKIIKSLQY